MYWVRAISEPTTVSIAPLPSKLRSFLFLLCRVCEDGRLPCLPGHSIVFGIRQVLRRLIDLGDVTGS